jgi:hypothetical protein
MRRRFGIICIALSAIVLLISGSSASLSSLSGSWKLEGGFEADSMELTQSGDHIYGTYTTPQGIGEIDGQIDNRNTWYGWWSDPLGDGHFSVIFSDDGNSFNGKWGYRYGGWDGPLNGKKLV